MTRAHVFAALLLGCGASSLPEPTVLGITPSSILASESVQVSVRTEAVLPFDADYGPQHLEVDPGVQLTVGAVKVDSRFERGGWVLGTLPSTLVPGHYDVTVGFSDGRAATLRSRFEVRPGQWPSNYVFDVVPNQVSGVPFDVTVRARGTESTGFHGNVTLTVSSGSVTPRLSGAFETGVRTERVTLTEAGPSVTLTARDADGHEGTSNAFDVTP